MIDSLLDAYWRMVICFASDVERAFVAAPMPANDPIGPKQPSFSCLYDGAAQ
jgi:hypothetical protein